MSTHDGGPAFPFGQMSELTGQPVNGFFAPGMSLRDHAMIQFIAAQIGKTGMDGTDINDTVTGAAMFFDAFMQARGAK